MTSKSWRDWLPIHPAAELFPLMDKESLRALADDIEKTLGRLLTPVTIIEVGRGQHPILIDGRNRLDALELLGREITREDLRDSFISSRRVLSGDCEVYALYYFGDKGSTIIEIRTVESGDKPTAWFERYLKGPRKGRVANELGYADGTCHIFEWREAAIEQSITAPAITADNTDGLDIPDHLRRAPKEGSTS
jgi:hypothetical protein